MKKDLIIPNQNLLSIQHFINFNIPHFKKYKHMIKSNWKDKTGSKGQNILKYTKKNIKIHKFQNFYYQSSIPHFKKCMHNIGNN